MLNDARAGERLRRMVRREIEDDVALSKRLLAPVILILPVLSDPV
jgi:hypothetical protein